MSNWTSVRPSTWSPTASSQPNRESLWSLPWESRVGLVCPVCEFLLLILALGQWLGLARGHPGVKFGTLGSGEAPRHGHQHPSAPPTLGCPTQGEAAGLASPRRKPLSTLTTHLQPPGQKRVPKNHPGAAGCRARRDRGASNSRVLLLASTESSRVLPGAGSRRLCVGRVALISHLLLAG